MNKFWHICFIILLLNPKTTLARSSKFELEARLDNLENKINGSLNFDLANKVELLAKEVQDLRGIVEEQQHLLNKLDINNNHNNSQNIEDKKFKYEIKDDLNNLQSNNVTAQLPDKLAYNNAYHLIENRKFQEALIAFKDFLLRYQDSTYAPNATYWIGELYFMDHKLDLAADYLLQVTKKYKNHDKSPDALLKLGVLELERSNYKLAKNYFYKVKEDYPDYSRAYIAEKKLKDLEKDGH